MTRYFVTVATCAESPNEAALQVVKAVRKRYPEGGCLAMRVQDDDDKVVWMFLAPGPDYDPNDEGTWPEESP